MYDIWVEVNAISKHALRYYPVAAGSGTSESLKILYGLSGAVSESVLRKLLVHLFHRVRRTSAFRAEKDSLATISLTLCGWHRSKQEVRHEGVRMSGLARAIQIEEQEYLDIRRELNELDLSWDVQGL